MYNYEKRLQYPVNIKIKSPKIAQIVLSQYGGPDGESAAAMRYMSQKFAMKNPKVAGLINDIAVEELGHLEMVGSIVSQLVKDLPCDDIDLAGFEKYYVDHTWAYGHSLPEVFLSQLLPSNLVVILLQTL